MAKRRRIRWDRVIITAAILIGLIFLFGSCVHSCTKRASEESSLGSPLDPLGSQNSQTSKLPDSRTVPEESSAAPALPSDYQEIAMPAAALYKGNLVLIDDAHPSRIVNEEIDISSKKNTQFDSVKKELDLVKVYDAADRADCYQLSYPGNTYLNRTALTQFNRLMTAYYAVTQNKDILFNYAFLTSGKQEKFLPDSATGLDIQLHLHMDNGRFGFITNTSPYSWIFEHMDSFGFIVRYPEDKSAQTGSKGSWSAIRYVGVPHSLYMTQNNLCLEEYLSLLRTSYTFGQGMLDFTSNDQSYRMYFVPANQTGDTNVPVPTNYAYEVSGNNIDGFVVTVFLK